MMKKLQATLSAISIVSLAMVAGAPAMAGEGGAAGAAVFRLGHNGQVKDSAVSGAVGKSNASATAFSITDGCDCKSTTLSATAFGSAGDLKAVIKQTDNSATIEYTGKADPNPGIGTENHKSSGTIVNKINEGTVSF